MIVDTHVHLFPPEWASQGRMPPDLFDVERQLERMDGAGIDVAVVSDPHIWYGDLDLMDIRNVRRYNEFVSELSRSHPGRFVGLATVSPWNGADHFAEAVRAIDDLGLAGVALPTSDGGRYLDSVPGEFFELLAEREAAAFVHPGGVTVGQELMDAYRLGEVCGRPLDMTVSLSRYVLTGAAERHPGVRLLCAHAGGAITMIADRLDFGHELRNYAPLGPWGEVELALPPSEYVKRLYLDTVTFGVGPLRLAWSTVGTDHLCFGTDGPPVPFEVSRHLALVESLGLDDDAKAKVLGGNAVELFALSER
jgi:aminocarboxymuconate-semialdehyde decarboxylase